MNNKISAALVVLAIVVIAILMISFLNTKPNYTTTSSTSPTTSSTSSTTTIPQNRFLVFGHGNSSAYSFNGAFIGTSDRSGTFASINTTINPILAVPSGQALSIQSNLSSLVTNSFEQRTGGHFAEKVLFAENPNISKTGLSNDFTLILYAGSRIGAGDDAIEVFTPNSTASWQIYMNGTTYYVANATFNEYVFLYGNRSAMVDIIPYGSSLSSSAAPTNSTLFPQGLLPYLNSLRLNSNLSFVSDGEWWYSNLVLYKFRQQPPAGFTLWK